MNELEKIDGLYEEILQAKDQAVAECNFDLAAALRDTTDYLSRARSVLSKFFTPAKDTCRVDGHDRCFASSLIGEKPQIVPWVCRRCQEEGSALVELNAVELDEYSTLRLAKVENNIAFETAKAAAKGLIIRGTPSQCANPLEWTISGGVEVSLLGQDVEVDPKAIGERIEQLRQAELLSPFDFFKHVLGVELPKKDG